MKVLQHLLAESWLVTIVGIGGIGKTRLALAVATNRQRAGQTTAFISLARLEAGDNLAATVVEALGLQLTTGTDPTSQLLTVLQQRTLLLVLDNFEHLLESTHLLAKMHQAAPGLTLLVTSRERLRLPGEQLLPIQGMQYPQNRREISELAKTGKRSQYPAALLFLNHARRLIPSFTPDNDDALLHLCRITNGLPLALELAAAWIDSLTLPDLVQELEHNLDFLTKKQPDLPIRQHSMRAVFDTTWQFLSLAEREAFARLAVFSGGFTRQAAQSVAESDLSVLSDLVGRYLVILDQKSGRYVLHELMRQYGVDKLAAAPELEHEVSQRHAQFFCEFLASRGVDLKNANQEAVLAEIDADRANIWIAWQWAAHHPQEISLADAIAPLGNACHLKCWIEDGYNLFTQSSRALSLNRDQPRILPSLLHLNVWRSRFALWLGRPADAPLIDVRMLLTEIPPSPTLRPLLALYHLVAEETFLDAGEREAAQTHGQQALGLYEGMDDAWGQAYALTQLGTVSWNVGAYTEALNYFEESLALHRQLGDSRGIAASLDRLGLLLMHQGELDLSSHYLEQAVDLFSRLGDQSGLADALENMGSNWLELGRLADAHRQYAAAAVIFEELGLRHSGYTVLKALTAYASAHEGAYQRAIQEGKTAVALSREFGHKRSEGLALITLGFTAVAIGDDAAAATYLTAGTGHLRAINQLDELAQGIGVQALVAYRQGELEKARQFILSALAIVTEIRGLWSSPGYPLAVWALILADQGEYERADSVYQLVLAEPFGAASRWFADIAGRFIPHSPPPSFMPPEDRWAAIVQLYQSLQ